MDTSDNAIRKQIALARLDGNLELWNMLLEYFLEDGPSLCKQLLDAMVAGDAELIHRTAHNLRGLAANLEATELVAMTEALERNPWSPTAASNDQFRRNVVEEFSRVIAAIQDERSS